MPPRSKRPYKDEIENLIPSDIYPVLDTDLARDNVENDLPAADLQDLHIPPRANNKKR